MLLIVRPSVIFIPYSLINSREMNGWLDGWMNE